jgi:molybdenum cofactor cytidylyltransferase
MGQPKLLLPWGNTTLIQHVVSNWKRSRVEHVIVVLHPDDHAIALECRGAFTTTTEPPPAEMKDSILCGIRTAEDDFKAGPGDVWLVAPADMPNLAPEVIDALLDAYAASSRTRPEETCIWATRHNGRRGHPVLLPWSLAPEVGTLAADEGLKTLLGRYPVKYVDVESDGIFVDVDTPDDYERGRPR